MQHWLKGKEVGILYGKRALGEESVTPFPCTISPAYTIPSKLPLVQRGEKGIKYQYFGANGALGGQIKSGKWCVKGLIPAPRILYLDCTPVVELLLSAGKCFGKSKHWGSP